MHNKQKTRIQWETKMAVDNRDFLVRRAEYSENLAEQHLKSMEYEKSAKFLKEAFAYYKKAGDNQSCVRIKEKHDGVVGKIKKN